MQSYSPDDIDRLVGCPKKIAQPPRKEMKNERGHLRNQMQLSSQDGSESFSVYMRKNERFQEYFSIGLRYHSKEGHSLDLIRYNGLHSQRSASGGDGLHFVYHIHRAQAQDINEGRLSLRHAVPTDAYASYEEALVHFVSDVNILDAGDHFGPLTAELPFDGEGE